MEAQQVWDTLEEEQNTLSAQYKAQFLKDSNRTECYLNNQKRWLQQAIKKTPERKILHKML